MKKLKTFAQRRANGEIYLAEDAAAILGYSAQYLRKLCHKEKVPHYRRKLDNLIYFEPAQLKGLFIYFGAKPL